MTAKKEIVASKDPTTDETSYFANVFTIFLYLINS